MALPEVNYTHANENWRQRLAKEKSAAQAFSDTYDYLVWKHTPTHFHRPSASCKVKYYKPLGGDWTVKDKRISLRERDNDDMLQADQVQELLADPTTARDAMKSCLVSHSQKMTEAKANDPLFKTTSAAYGSRRPLEMFGVCQHGIKATRSKEPVGNGSKIYTT